MLKFLEDLPLLKELNPSIKSCQDFLSPFYHCQILIYKEFERNKILPFI